MTSEPREPVTVWGDESEPILRDAPLKMACGFIAAAEDPDELYIQDDNGEEWILADGYSHNGKGRWELA